jgi:coenzyme F420-reducing hydrogenase beta subunit
MAYEGTYAVTALPCFAQAIRLAQAKNHKLRKRIKLIIGLVCGQMKTKEFTHELARNALGTDRLSSVKYRVKQPNEPASNFAFEFISKENGSVGRLSWTAQLDGPAKLWGSRAFTPMACNNCTDVFAHCADLILMDAWLPEYIKDYRGHTLVISRTHEMTNFLETLSDMEMHPISAKKVLLSQQAVVDNKNAVALGSNNFFLSKTTKIRLEIQQLSLIDYEKNKDEIMFLYQKIATLNKIKGIVMLPKRVVFKLFRILQDRR